MEGVEQHSYNNGGLKTTNSQQCLHKAEPPSRILTLPTILTLARVAVIPVLVAEFASLHSFDSLDINHY